MLPQNKKPKRDCTSLAKHVIDLRVQSQKLRGREEGRKKEERKVSRKE